MSGNKEKLTTQIAAMYFGCKVVRIIEDEKTPYDKPFRGINFLTNEILLCWRKDHWDWFPIDDAKLILKPFSDKSLTSTQRKELAKIYYEEDDDDIFLIENISFNLFDSVKNAANCINYLRSIQIDCDNLLERNIAITG